MLRLLIEQRNRLCDHSLEKNAEELFYHRTSNIEPLLRIGKIKTLKSLAKSTPTMSIAVEPKRWSRQRELLPIQEAVTQLQTEGKNPDKIFLTKEAPLGDPTYGDYIIEKKLKSPKPSDIFNLIPNEYLHNRDISLKRRAAVYVPTVEEAKIMRKKYPGITFKSKENLQTEELPSKSYSSLLKKLLATTGLVKLGASNKKLIHNMNAKEIKRHLGANAMFVGSKNLGTSLHTSDTDVLVPYSNKTNMLKAKQRLMQRYGLQESPYNTPTRNRYVLQDLVNNVDVTLALQKDAEPFIKSYLAAKKSLSDQDRKKIITKKRELQHSFWFPEKRYKRYKRELDKRLNIVRM